MDKRLGSIDALRGIAAFSVVYFHATNAVSNFPVNELLRSSGALGYLGVDIFFVISGFIIPYSMWRAGFIMRTHWKTYLLKRLVRIEPAYIVSIALTILMGVAVNVFYQKDTYSYDLIQIMAHFLYLNSFVGYEWVNPVYWTLAIEFQFYLLLIVLYPALVSEKGRVFFLILGGVGVLLFPDAPTVIKYSPLFMIGIGTFLYFTEHIKKNEYVFWLIFSISLALWSLNLISILVGVLTGLIILYVKIPQNKVVIFLGMISYSIYLIHYPIVEKLVRIGKHYGFSFFDQSVVLIFSLCISALFAYLLYLAVEKPSMIAASKKKYKT